MNACGNTPPLRIKSKIGHPFIRNVILMPIQTKTNG
jgi:hypothetical protein